MKGFLFKTGVRAGFPHLAGFKREYLPRVAGERGSGVFPACGRMAGRASGRGSENHTRPRNGLAGALCLTAVQGLERGVQLVEAMATRIRTRGRESALRCWP